MCAFIVIEILRNTRQIQCKAVEQRATLIHRQYNRDWGTSYSRPPIDPYLISPLLQNPGGDTGAENTQLFIKNVHKLQLSTAVAFRTVKFTFYSFILSQKFAKKIFTLVRDVIYRHCSRSITVRCPFVCSSVRVSVCLSHLSTAVCRFGVFAAVGPAARRHRRAPQQHGAAQQHGAQQQTRAVSRCQLT